jgi:hypothetical protein
MISKTDRLRAAAEILKGSDSAEIEIRGYHKVSKLTSLVHCDTCKKETDDGKCMSRTMLVISLEEEDHKHVCDECAKKLECGELKSK